MHYFEAFDNYRLAKQAYIKATFDYDRNKYEIGLFFDDFVNKWTLEIEEMLGSWQIDPVFEK